jgi:hypothetical protein
MTRRAAVLFILVAPACHAAEPRDEAFLRDGRTRTGTLALADKRLVVRTADGALPLTDVDHVRLAAASVPVFRLPVVHRVVLQGDQQLTGEFLGLDTKQLRLRTAWSESLALPRSAVVVCTQRPGWALVFADDFENGLAAWRTTGEPVVGDRATSGKRGLWLGAVGQSAEYTLREPLLSGRFSVNVRDERAAGGRWHLEADFRLDKGTRTVRVLLGGAGDRFDVDPVGLDGNVRPVARGTDWRRLTVQFSPSSLRVVADDAVCWWSLERGPGGPLERVRLVGPAGVKTQVQGGVAADDFALERAATEPARPPGDATQDEIWLQSGDQWFGTIRGADRAGVELQSRSGVRRLPWTDVRGLWLRRDAVAPPRTSGEVVELRLRTGLDGMPDRISGAVERLDERTIALRHAVLGLIELERGRVEEVRLLPSR